MNSRESCSWAQMRRLFESERNQLVELTLKETGFVRRDSEDLVEAAWLVLDAYSNLVAEQPRQILTSRIPDRQIELHQRPYGGVAVILPQNAALYLGVLAGLSAASAGNKVWIKPPTSCPGTTSFLKRLLATLSIEVVDQPGRVFMEWATHDPNVHLVHLIGSSEVGASHVEALFRGGKQALVDGNGNCYAYVSPNADVTKTMEQLTAASTRFNGETCTATKGALIHPDLYQELVDSLSAHFDKFRVGDPADEGVDVGPLFGQSAAESIRDVLRESGGRILSGGTIEAGCLRPTLVENPDRSSRLVTEGVFGPVLWVQKGHLDDFRDIWSANQYPLCAAVYSDNEADRVAIASLPRLSRLTVNGDSSLEDPLEPWGALPSSGNGRVEAWTARYTRTVQIDTPFTSSYSPRQ